MLKHAFKFYEKILDGQLHQLVDIDKIKYRFMLGKDTVDSVFILGRHAEKFRSKNKKLFFVFLDLKKAIKVPREVI